MCNGHFVLNMLKNHHAILCDDLMIFHEVLLLPVPLTEVAKNGKNLRTSKLSDPRYGGKQIGFEEN